MNWKYTISFAFFLFALSSCVEEVDYPLPNTKEEVVLNGFLSPDSTIQVQLSKIIPLTGSSDTFPTVENATISLFENGELLGKLEHIGQGRYHLAHTPTPGNEYSVEATVPDYGTLTASDVVPPAPTIKSCYRSYDKEGDVIIPNTTIRTTISDNRSVEEYFWFELAATTFVQREGELCTLQGDSVVCQSEYDSSRLIRQKTYYFYSRSIEADKFNAFVDNTVGGDYYFESYLRLSDEAFGGQAVTVDIKTYGEPFTALPNLDAQQSAILNVYSGSRAFDRYLKSALTNYLNTDSDEPNPFFFASKVYSNVNGGTGIFAAYTLASVALERHPCD